MAKMSPSEQISYAAIKTFNDCMRPHVEAAKHQRDLSDQQIEHFGQKCPKELEQVAQTMAKRPLSSFHGSIPQNEWISDFDERLAHYRKSFAGSFGCELRPGSCPVL